MLAQPVSQPFVTRMHMTRTRGTGRTSTIICCAFYVLVFYVSYTRALLPTYRYEGYSFFFSPAILILTSLLAFLPSLWLPVDLQRPSQLVYWALYLLVLVPVCIVPVYSLKVSPTSTLALAAAVVASFFLLGCIYRLPLLKLNALFRWESYQFTTAVLVLTVVFYSFITYVFGFRFELSLLKVYDLRSEYTWELGQVGPLVAYAVNWQAYVLNPFFMGKGLVTRKFAWTAAGVGGQALLYSITGFKSVFFSAAFVLILVVLLRKPEGFGRKLAYSMAGLLFVSAVLYVRLGWIWMLSLFVNRLVAETGLLTGFYYEFFSQHAKVMLSHSILSRFSDYPYPLEPPRLIGQVYFHSATSANANIWADAYANFGYFGIVLFTAILGLVLLVYDSVSARTDFRIATLVLAMPALALANSGLLTCLLSHGIGMALLLVWLLPRQRGVLQPRAAGTGVGGPRHPSRAHAGSSYQLSGDRRS